MAERSGTSKLLTQMPQIEIGFPTTVDCQGADFERWKSSESQGNEQGSRESLESIQTP